MTSAGLDCDSVERLTAIEDDQRLKRNTQYFIYAKLLLTLTGIVIFATIFWPHQERLYALAVLAVVDSLLLIPYHLWAPRSTRAATVWTLASLAFSTSVATFGIYLTGNSAGPAILAYFALLPMACLVIPRPQMAWAMAGISSLAYMTLITAEAGGLVPDLGGSVRDNPTVWLVISLVAVPAFWVAGGLIGRVVTSLEQQRVERKSLYEETLRRAKAESIWNTVGKSVISTQDLDQVLTTVIQVINEKMAVETASVALRVPGTDDLVFAKILRTSAEQLNEVRLRVGHGILGWVVSSGLPALVPDVTQDPRWDSSIDRETGFKTRSILCVPLIAKDKVIGALELLNKRGGGFTEDDLQLLESIAAPVAIAVQNARLHQQVYQQLTELTDLFQEVERAKREWETSVDAIEEGILLLDEHGRILRLNRTLAKWLHTDTSVLLGRYCCQAIHGLDATPDYCPHVQPSTQPERPREVEMEIASLGGSFRCISYPLRDGDGAFGGAVTVLKDVTAEKRIQAQLIQSEKLAATGRMAASLAHEINNPLQAIQGCLDLVHANPADPQKQQRYLTLARNEVERLAAIVQRMLDFYRPSKGVRMPTDVRQLVDDVLVFSAKRLQHARVTARTVWEAGNLCVEGIPNQLKQVFLNLVLNAVDAMPNGGELLIRGEIVEREGPWLSVEFVDTGTGIPPEDLDRIFEPFYTTKMTGTGLGLGISHSIVSSHGGRLTVSSAIGKGSIFTVWLPITPAPSA